MKISTSRLLYCVLCASTMLGPMFIKAIRFSIKPERPIIQNPFATLQPIPCSSTDGHRVELDSDALQQLADAKHVVFSPDFMARDVETAAETFPDFLASSERDFLRINTTTRLTKRSVHEELVRYHALQKRLQNTPQQREAYHVPITVPMTSLPEYYADVYRNPEQRHNQTHTKQYSGYKSTVLQSSKKSNLKRSAFHKLLSNTVKRKDNWRNFIHGAPSSNSQDVWLRNIEQSLFNLDVRLLKQFVPVNTLADHPTRVRRESGEVTQVDYCRIRGNQTGGYLYLCTLCSATTILPEDHFPRVINEIICSQSDRNCLRTYGQCRQNILNLTMLRKKENGCQKFVHENQTYIIDEWELYTQPIRIACECMVDRRSPLARLARPSTI